MNQRFLCIRNIKEVADTAELRDDAIGQLPKMEYKCKLHDVFLTKI